MPRSFPRNPTAATALARCALCCGGNRERRTCKIKAPTKAARHILCETVSPRRRTTAVEHTSARRMLQHKASRGFEPRSLDSESRVLAVTPRGQVIVLAERTQRYANGSPQPQHTAQDGRHRTLASSRAQDGAHTCLARRPREPRAPVRHGLAQPPTSWRFSRERPTRTCHREPAHFRRGTVGAKLWRERWAARSQHATPDTLRPCPPNLP